MHSVAIKEQKKDIVSFYNMPKGSFGIVQPGCGEYEGLLVLRCGKSVVSISDPSVYWDSGLENNPIHVRLLHPGDKFEVTVGI